MRSNVERDSRGREKSSIIRREKEIVILVPGMVQKLCVNTMYICRHTTLPIRYQVGTIPVPYHTMVPYIPTSFLLPNIKNKMPTLLQETDKEEKKKENVKDAVLSRQARRMGSRLCER